MTKTDDTWMTCRRVIIIATLLTLGAGVGGKCVAWTMINKRQDCDMVEVKAELGDVKEIVVTTAIDMRILSLQVATLTNQMSRFAEWIGPYDICATGG